jgi:putative flippase GtrA
MARLPTFVEAMTAAWHRRHWTMKAMSFGVIGVSNTLVDVTVFFLALTYVTRALIVANLMSWLVAVSYSYVMNSVITFARESDRKLRWTDYGRFVVSGLAGVIVNTTVLLIAAKYFPIWAAKACAIVASFGVNFSLSHFVVFRRRADTAL